jgi:hypothetical protein
LGQAEYFLGFYGKPVAAASNHQKQRAAFSLSNTF